MREIKLIEFKSLKLSIAWFDMWIGCFYNQSKSKLYICPLPFVLVTISFKNSTNERVLDEEFNYDYMNVGDLKAIISDIPNDTEVKIRTCHNATGNIAEAGNAELTSYVFFGKSIPCVIIEPAYIDYIIDPKIKDLRKEKYAQRKNRS